MNEDFNTKKLIKLIKQISPKTILIHQDHKLNLKNILKDVSKNMNVNMQIKTSDLRYTQGENKKLEDAKSEDKKLENTNLIIYITDSYEPQNAICRTINNYVEGNDLIFISEKKSAKRILNLFECNEKFQTGSYSVGHLKKQKPMSVDVEEHTIKINIDNINLSFYTEQGLFSYKKIDEGTLFLLNNIKIDSTDKILDFACGYGVIGITLAKKYPQSNITMTDSKQKATEFTKKNAEINNTKNIEVKNAYLLRGISGKYDKIISNPPTHMKLNELEELMKKFKELLKNQGEIYLVINNIVNYERVAKKYFNEIQISNQNEQYKIIQIKN